MVHLVCYRIHVVLPQAGICYVCTAPACSVLSHPIARTAGKCIVARFSKNLSLNQPHTEGGHSLYRHAYHTSARNSLIDPYLTRPFVVSSSERCSVSRSSSIRWQPNNDCTGGHSEANECWKHSRYVVSIAAQKSNCPSSPQTRYLQPFSLTQNISPCSCRHILGPS